MRKLLYTLILGLVVVSCDKSYEESIEAPLASQEVSEDIIINGLLDQLISDLSSGKIATTEAPSSARNAEDFLYLRFFNDGTNNYVLFTTENEDDEFCIGDSMASQIADRYYDNLNDGAQLGVRVAASGTTVLMLDGSFSGLFAAEFAVAYKLDSRSLIVGTGVVNGTTITFI